MELTSKQNHNGVFQCSGDVFTHYSFRAIGVGLLATRTSMLLLLYSTPVARTSSRMWKVPILTNIEAKDERF